MNPIKASKSHTKKYTIHYVDINNNKHIRHIHADVYRFYVDGKCVLPPNSFLEGHRIDFVVLDLIDFCFFNISTFFLNDSEVHDLIQNIGEIPVYINSFHRIDDLFLKLQANGCTDITEMLSSTDTTLIKAKLYEKINLYVQSKDILEKWAIYWDMIQYLYGQLDFVAFAAAMPVIAFSLNALFAVDKKSDEDRTFGEKLIGCRAVEKFVQYVERGRELSRDPKLLRRRLKFLENRKGLTFLYHFRNNGVNFDSLEGMDWNHMRDFAASGMFLRVPMMHREYIPYSDEPYLGLIVRCIFPLVYVAYTEKTKRFRPLAPKIFEEGIKIMDEAVEITDQLQLKPNELINPAIYPELEDRISVLMTRLFGIFLWEPIKEMLVTVQSNSKSKNLMSQLLKAPF